ncbi:hypothetical protein IWX49DRAFT_576241 [Phyllosticta citricarpa]
MYSSNSLRPTTVHASCSINSRRNPSIHAMSTRCSCCCAPKFGPGLWHAPRQPPHAFLSPVQRLIDAAICRCRCPVPSSAGEKRPRFPVVVVICCTTLAFHASPYYFSNLALCLLSMSSFFATASAFTLAGFHFFRLSAPSVGFAPLRVRFRALPRLSLDSCTAAVRGPRSLSW